MKPFSFWNNNYSETVNSVEIKGIKTSAVIGWAGIQISDPKIDIVELCAEYSNAFARFSCGQCIPCRDGSKAIAEIFQGMRQGKGIQRDIEHIERLSETIAMTSLCEIGRSSPRIFSYLFKHQRAYFEKSLKNRAVKKHIFSYKSFLTAPCMEACPIHLDIPRYVEAVKNKRYQEGLNLILQRLPLPGVLGRVCVRPCEFNCRRTLVDEPIQIRHLKRFLSDNHEGNTKGCVFSGEPPRNYRRPECEPSKGLKAAIVGAGPAGITCAYFLALKGYEVSVFEMFSEPGGMAAVGIPDYRLPREIIKAEVSTIEGLGVKFHYGTALGTDFTIDDLEAQGFKAIFIGLGCHSHKKMGVEGEDAGYDGFIPGVYFLRNVNLGNLDKIPKGKKIAVVGGGNVAIDCVRTALRVGFEESALIYRRSQQEMPADFVEVRDAKAEGVKFYFLAAPKRIIAEDGKIKGIECIWMQLGEPDSSGRRRPVEMPGSEFFVEADVIVPAIGQEGDSTCLSSLSGVEITKKGSILVNEHLMSSRTGIFSGGDCVTGPDVLIKACAQGRKAALKIDQFLSNGRMDMLEEEFKEAFFNSIKPFDPKEQVVYPVKKRRISVKHEHPLQRRTDFREVDKAFTEDEAETEASRCLRCYRIAAIAFRREE